MGMENVASILSKRYGVVLSEESTRLFNSTLICRQYSTNEIILAQNKICSDVYIIEQGMVRQFYYKDGRDISEHFSCEIDVVFCIESLFLKEPTSLLMEAIEPTIIHHLNYEQLQDLCDHYNDINRLYRRIMELDLIVSQRKADSWRFESSRERYQRFCKEYPEVNRRASVAQIATYLLMTPETLSRVRAGVL